MTDQELQEWFDKCNENLTPLPDYYYSAAKAGSSFFFGPMTPISTGDDNTAHTRNKGNSMRDITAAEVDRIRIECIAALRKYDRGREADMLQDTHYDQQRIRAEYKELRII